MAKVSFLFYLLFFQVTLLFAQNIQVPSFTIKSIGIPPMTNYSPSDYHFSNQNFDVLIGDDQRVYMGNNSGVLIFDGSQWTQLSLPNESAVYSLRKAKDGTIYVGGVNEIGYLSTQRNGELKYTSLYGKLADESMDAFSSLIFIIENQVVFSAGTKTIIYNHLTEEMKVIDSPEASGNYYSLQESQGIMYAYARDSLFQLRDGHWGNVKQSSLISSSVFGMGHLHKINNNKTIAITQNGFFDFNTEKRIKINKEVGRFLKQSTIYSVKTLNSDYISICTFSGLLITDLIGNPILYLDKKKGLADDFVFDTALDNSGMLWVATNNGLTKIDIFSAYSIFDERMGVEGVITDTQLRDGDVYITSVSGVYREKLEHLKMPFAMPEWKKMSAGVSHGMINSKSELVVFTELEHNLALNNNVFEEIPDTQDDIYWSGIKYEDSDDLLLGSITGKLIHLNKKKDHWIMKKELDPTILNSRYMVQGNGLNIWMSNINEGVFKLVYDKEQAEILEEKKYGKAEGLPSDLNNVVFAIDSKPCFVTSKGIYQYDSISGRFSPDHRFSNVVGQESISLITNDAKGDIYYFSDKLNLLKKTETDYVKTNFPTIDYLKYLPTAISVLDSHNVIISSINGLLHIDPTQSQMRSDFDVNFTNVSSPKTDSIHFGGFGNTPTDLTLIHSDNAIRISFSAAYYQNIDQTQYKCRLKGIDEKWSSWSSETKKDYTNLPHGDYTFEVVAKNVYEMESPTATIQFTIETPWFYSYWAYSMYAFGALVLLWVIVKMNTQRLVNETRQLEQVVNDRTEVISRQKETAVKDAATIASQRDKLLQMDEMKSRFFLNISHELRTPLTLTMGTVDQALKGKYGSLNDELYANLKVSYRNSQRLLKMVNNILDISKLEGGKMHLSASKTKPIEVLSKVIDFFSSKFFGKNIVMKSDLTSDVELYIDHDKFETIFINLIANAIKFTNEGGRISLAVKEESEVVCISVNDNGIGIPAEDLAFVFDRFYQSSLTKNGEGTGVGLALTKELAELHKGSIAVRSDAEEGTTFTVTFLKGKDHLTANQILEQDDAQGLKSLAEKYPIIDDVRKKEVKHQKSQAIDTSKPHVLLVEDNPELSKFVEDLLKDNYHVSRAENGQEGLDFLKSSKPDLILTDYLMPVMDGFQMTTEIKKNDDWAFIPIIFLTARTQEQDKIGVLNLGVDDYLFKPFNEEELKVRINNLLNAKSQRAEFVLQKSIDPRDIEWKEFPSKLKLDIDNFIKANIKEEISGENLSAITGQSERSLYRKVKVNTGLSLMQYIKEYRLRTARALLESKEVQSVSEVSYAVGFNYLSHFTKNYKERFGKKPSEYME